MPRPLPLPKMPSLPHFNCLGHTSKLWLTLRIYLFSYLLRANTDAHAPQMRGEWWFRGGGEGIFGGADKDLKDLHLLQGILWQETQKENITSNLIFIL